MTEKTDKERERERDGQTKKERQTDREKQTGREEIIDAWRRCLTGRMEIREFGNKVGMVEFRMQTKGKGKRWGEGKGGESLSVKWGR